MAMIIKKVGGSADAPALLTLGTWGSATVISASNWAQHKASVSWANSGYSAGWILMSATQWLNVWRRNSDNALYYGVLTLDAAGDVDTENACAALSDFTTGGAAVALRRLGTSATNLLVASGKTASTSRLELGEYALSGSTLTLQNSLLTQNTSTDGVGTLRGFAVEVGTDFGVIACYSDNGSIGFYPFRITATQAFGSFVDTDTVGITSQDQAGMMSWQSQSTDNVFYFSTRVLTKIVLSEANPPTLVESDIFSGDAGAWCYGTEAMLSNRGLIVPAPTEAADGNITFITNFGMGQWSGEGNAMTFAQHTSRNGLNMGGYGSDTINLFGRFNLDYVQVDTDGDWVRGVLILAHPAVGTTGLTAIPLNINPKDRRYVAGTPSQTTNLTPHQNLPCNFGACYHSSWTTPGILIACEDTGAAPSYIKLPITVT